jgi:chromosome segregation ATPase
MTMRPSTSSTNTDNDTHQLLRDEARVEADRLRREISQSATELQRLEQLSQQVRQGAYKPSVTPPPLSGKERNGVELRVPSQGSLRSPGTNGVRSSSTGKLIEHLQHEVSSLKLTAESYRRQFESEKGAREALKVKCDDLEGSLSSARVESRSHALSLSRSDKALQAAIEAQQQLALRLQEAEEARKGMEQERVEDANALTALREVLAKESATRERIEQEGPILAEHHRRFKEESQAQLTALKEQFEALRKDLVGDGGTRQSVWAAQEEVAALRARQEKESASWESARRQIESARQEEATLLAEQVSEMQKEVLRVAGQLDEHEQRVGVVQREWADMKSGLNRPGG